MQTCLEWSIISRSKKIKNQRDHPRPIAKTPEVISSAHVISSKGCEAQKDNVHFNAAGTREFGLRYASKMLELLNE